MMPLIAAVAVLALVVCLLDLVLTLGVIRRLREHTELITKLPTLSMAAPMLAEGETAAAFEARATTGEPLSLAGLVGETLVGGFSPHCPACEERLPDFVAYASTFTGGRDQVIAVIAGPEDEAETYRQRLEPVARVVVEPPAGGPISTALAFGAYPVFGILDQSGTVVRSGMQLDQQTADVGA